MKTEELIQILRDPDNPNVLDYIDEAADRLEEMATYLKENGDCDTCRHCDVPHDQEPCESCMVAGGYPKWEWKGENHA